jgi:hypothetical protein
MARGGLSQDPEAAARQLAALDRGRRKAAANLVAAKSTGSKPKAPAKKRQSPGKRTRSGAAIRGYDDQDDQEQEQAREPKPRQRRRRAARKPEREPREPERTEREPEQRGALARFADGFFGG